MLAKELKSEDLRVRRTRFLLQEKFWELLADQSFQSITVQDITARAMVNRATFYDHFVDKYALLQYSIREWFRDTLEKQQSAGAGGMDENLPGIITTACEFLAKLRYHCLPRDNAVLPLVQTTITDLIAETLLEWLTPRGEKASSDLRLNMTVTSWAIYGAAFYWSQVENPEDLEAFTQRVLPMILASVERTPPLERSL
jgi:AcrR family transcriptional regulator